MATAPPPTPCCDRTALNRWENASPCAKPDPEPSPRPASSAAHTIEMRLDMRLIIIRRVVVSCFRIRDFMRAAPLLLPLVLLLLGQIGRAQSSAPSQTIRVDTQLV